MSISQALETAYCIQINAQNMIRIDPNIGHNPMFLIMKEQIGLCIKELEQCEEDQINGK